MNAPIATTQTGPVPLLGFSLALGGSAAGEQRD